MSGSFQDTPEALRHRAEAALANGDIENAERHLVLALCKSPDDDRTLALLAELRLRRGELADAFALWIRAVNAAPEIHHYKERFLELARRGIDVVHSAPLEMAVAACLRTPELAADVENWAALLMANPAFEAAYGLRKRQAFDMATPL